MSVDFDSILDDLFHACALIAFVEQAVEQGCWPDAEMTRVRAYALHERALAERNAAHVENGAGTVTSSWTSAAGCGMVKANVHEEDGG